MVHVFFVMVSVVWMLAACRWVVRLRRLPDLPRVASGPSSASRVTVVIAARNEVQRIAQTVERLLAQQGVDLDIVVVDDRSTDGTGLAVHAIAARCDRVSVLRVDALPDEWLGKCHALHLGSQQAKGDWILFTDGDVWMAPDVVARALATAEREDADHVTLLPGFVERPSWFGEACLLSVVMVLGKSLAKTHDPRCRIGLGIGAFNLVRASAYRAIGGHRAIRLEVPDDAMLGRLLLWHGFRARGYLALRELTCDWADGPRSLVRLFEKNLFAMLRFRTPLAVAWIAVFGSLWLAGLLGPFTGTLAGSLAGVGLGSMAVPAFLTARRVGWRLSAAVAVPVALGVFWIAMFHSTVKTLWQGGVRWRDTFYPLPLLRAGLINRRTLGQSMNVSMASRRGTTFSAGPGEAEPVATITT